MYTLPAHSKVGKTLLIRGNECLFIFVMCPRTRPRLLSVPSPLSSLCGRHTNGAALMKMGGKFLLE